MAGCPGGPTPRRRPDDDHFRGLARHGPGCARDRTPRGFPDGLTASPRLRSISSCRTRPTNDRARASSCTTACSSTTIEKEPDSFLGLDRVLADLACRLRPWNALAVIDEALACTVELERTQMRRRIRELISTRPDPRGTRIGSRLVDLATGRAESPSESWLLWRVVDLGFPTPAANLPVLDIDGREVYRLDLGWEELKSPSSTTATRLTSIRRRPTRRGVGTLSGGGGSWSMQVPRTCIPGPGSRRNSTRLSSPEEWTSAVGHLERFGPDGTASADRDEPGGAPTNAPTRADKPADSRRRTCPLAPANVATRGYQPAGARRRWWRPVSVTRWGGVE